MVINKTLLTNSILALIFSMSLANNMAFADPIKQAMKAIEDGELSKAQEYVFKSLEKDSVNPSAYYLNALLLQVDSFPGYNLDSAYLNINKSIAQFGALDKKSASRLEKYNHNLAVFQYLKTKIETAAFNRATATSEIAVIETYMSSYENDSLQIRARNIRDSLAYFGARKTNTWQAFKYFLKTYPETKYTQDAQESYEWLLFKDKTTGNKLTDLESFYRDHPGSPYLNRVIREIYLQRTAGNEEKAHLQFISKYPESIWASESRAILYHMFPDNRDYIWDESFEQISLLNKGSVMPFYAKGKFGFLNPTGDQVMEPKFEQMAEGSFCKVIEGAVIEVVDSRERMLIDRTGKVLLTGFTDWKALGYGFLAYQKEGKYGLHHQSGIELISPKFEDLKLLHTNLIAYLRDGIWGICTIRGEIIYEPYFDAIDNEGDLVLFYKDEQIALRRIADILEDYRSEPTLFSFKYEEVEFLGDGYMIAISDDQEALLNNQQEELIPLGDHTIYCLDKDWYIRHDSGYQRYDETQARLIDDIYEDIQSNHHWLGIKKDRRWTLISRDQSIQPRFKLDSIKLISETLVYFKDDLFQRVIFGTSKEISIGNDQLVKPVLRSTDALVSDFIVVAQEKQKTLYNPQGEQLFSIQCDAISLLNDSIFIIGKSGKKGLADATGQYLLKPIYNSIDVDLRNPGVVHLLRDGKIGAYHIKTSTLINTKFDTRVIPFGEGKYIVNDRGFGIWDLTEEEYIGEKSFQELIPMRDSFLIAKKDDFFEIRTANLEVLFEDIFNYEIINDSEDSMVIRFRVEEGYGLFDAELGLLLKPVYNEILKLPAEADTVYYAERYLDEAELYVIMYADSKGNKISSQAFTIEEYENLACDL